MTVLRTDAGATHYTQLVAQETGGAAPTQTFNTLMLGQGNVVPTVSDVSPLASAITVSALTVLPVSDDTDPRNTGSGAAVYTWAFRVPGGATPVVASNVALGTTATTALAIHADEVVWTEPYRDTLIWLNLNSTGATLVTAFENNPVQAARLRATGSRADILHGGPGSQVMRPGYVYSTVYAGESVPLRARLYGQDDLELRSSDVKSVTVDIFKYDASRDVWVKESRRALSRCLIEVESQALSALFPYRGGFNFEYIHAGTLVRDGISRKLVYTILLCDASIRKITQEVRVRG